MRRSDSSIIWLKTSEINVERHGYDMLLWLIGQHADAEGRPDNSWERACAVARLARPGTLGAVEALRAAHARADALAIAFGKRWRSMLVARSFLLLLASICSGLLGTLFSSLSVVTIPIQAAVTILIFFDERHAARNQWRAKWIEYRRLAETLARRAVPRLVRRGAGPGRRDGLGRVDSPSRDPRGGAVRRARRGGGARRHRASRRGRDRRTDRLSPRRVPSVPPAGPTHSPRRSDRSMRLCGARGAALAVLPLAHFNVISVSFTSAISLTFIAAPTLYAKLNSVRRDLDVVRQAARSAEIEADLKRLARSRWQAPQRPRRPPAPPACARRKLCAMMSPAGMAWWKSCERRKARVP